MRVIAARHQFRQERAADAPADFIAGDHTGDELLPADRLLLRERENHGHCCRAGMAAALIVVIVELATLREGSIHEDRVVKRNFIAIFYDPCRAATFRAFYKSIDRLIPRHTGADQLATQLIQQ